MRPLVLSNLSTGALTSGGKAWVPPVLQWGETLSFRLRFAREVDGTTEEYNPEIQATRAAIGIIDVPPQSGQWALQVGPGASTADNTTAPLPYNTDAKGLQEALEAKAAVLALYGPPQVTVVDGSWLVTFGQGGQQVPLLVVRNTLRPFSRGRVFAYEIDGRWTHEVRLMQAPAAFSDTTTLVLPEPPATKPIRDGGGSGDGVYTFNELQELYVPAAFRGQYFLQTDSGRQTVALGKDDDETTIQDALLAVLGKGNVGVTLVEDQRFQVEFTGALAGTNIGLLQVVLLDPPPGDLTIDLALDKAPLWALLRTTPAVTLPLQVRVSILEEGVLIKKDAVVAQVTVERGLHWDDQAVVPDFDYLRPLSPTTYTPFSPNTVITGHQFFPAVVGDGVSTLFTVDHGLDSETVFVFARENQSNGRQLVQGMDFDVRLAGADSVEVTALTDDPPLTNAWAVVVFSAQTVAAFANGLTVTIGQVTGLQTALAALTASVGALQAQAATIPLGLVDQTVAVPVTFEVPDREDLFPGESKRSGSAIDLSKLPRPRPLFPALHVAGTTSISSPTAALPDPVTAAGTVYQNNTGAPLLLPVGFGYRSAIVPATGFFGSDGRALYPVRRSGVSTSYFPIGLERTGFVLEINSQMLRAGAIFNLALLAELQLLLATSGLQYLLVLEWGTLPSQATPATTAGNLQEIAWNATPMLSQRVVLSDVKTTHSFGLQIIRAANGTLSANKIVYGFKSATGSVPTSADFALRLRLMNADTENNVADAVGLVFTKLRNVTAEIK